MGKMEAETGVTVVEIFKPRLPNEMVLEIFRYVPNSVLLDCRLVSKRWTYLASNKCRNRQFQLNTTKWHDNPEDAFVIFPNAETVPWSTCTLVNVSAAYRSDTPQGKRSLSYPGERYKFLYFIELHRMKLRTLTTIGTTLEYIFDFLSYTPNLVVLNVCSLPYPSDPLLPSDPSVASCLQLISSKFWYSGNPYVTNCLLLLRLKTLPRLYSLRKMSLDAVGICGPLTSDFIYCQPALEKLRLNYSFSWSNNRNGAWRVLIAGKNVSRISLALDYTEDGKTLVNKLIYEGVRLHNLCLNVFHPSRNGGISTYYNDLEQLLEANKATLEKLSLTTYISYSIASPSEFKSHIPCLPKLKCIKFNITKLPVYAAKDVQRHPKPFGYPYVIGGSHQFPVLRKVEFVNYEPYPGFQVIFDPGTVHRSVEELLLNGECIMPNLVEANFAAIFPKLKTLKTRVDAKNLRYIFHNMHNLQNLDIAVDASPITRDWFGRITDEANVNFVFSGIRNPSKAISLPETELQTVRANATLPSILDLQELKNLKIVFPDMTSWNKNREVFNDSGAILSLLPLQPLTTLELRNVQMSPDCEAKLNSRHGFIKVFQLPRQGPDQATANFWLYDLFHGRL